MNLGCYPAIEDESESDIEVPEEIDSPATPSPPPTDSGPQKDVPPSNDDGGFDSCPSDTYYFELSDGSVMMFEIEVFCDPMPYINMGCPAPDM